MNTVIDPCKSECVSESVSVSEWHSALPFSTVQVPCITQLAPAITQLCTEYNLSCESSMCGFMAIAVSSYVSYRANKTKGGFSVDSLNDLLRDICNEEIMLPLIRSAVVWIVQRRERYLLENEDEFPDDVDRLNYRQTMVGGQEISEWITSGAKLDVFSSEVNQSGESTEVNDHESSISCPVFLRNVATGPPGEVTTRFKEEDYQGHADKRVYLSQELPFCDGSDFFVQSPLLGCISLMEWCQLVFISQRNSVPMIADFWGHYSTLFPVHLNYFDGSDKSKILLLCLDSLPTWEVGEWVHPKAVMRSLSITSVQDNGKNLHVGVFAISGKDCAEIMSATSKTRETLDSDGVDISSKIIGEGNAVGNLDGDGSDCDDSDGDSDSVDSSDNDNDRSWRKSRWTENCSSGTSRGGRGGSERGKGRGGGRGGKGKGSGRGGGSGKKQQKKKNSDGKAGSDFKRKGFYANKCKF